jgi:predicted dinucleotide-binding enzyme
MSSQTIGIIGAGNIGSQLARLAVRTGHDVVIANSRGPETLADLVAELGDHARAGTREEAAEAGEVVIVSTPLTAVETLPVEPLVGKVVIDTNNYYPHRDGHIRALDDETTTSSELLQERLVGARVVKAFNHIGARFLTKDARPAGAEWRRALVIAGDDAAAKQVVADLIDQFGFDVVDAGPLAEGWRIAPDTPGYADRFTAEELRHRLAEAKRHRDR